MSAYKYPSIFPRQMEAIVHVYHTRELHNYSVPCQYNQSDMRATHDGKVGCNNVGYYMAVSHKDWELPSSRI